MKNNIQKKWKYINNSEQDAKIYSEINKLTKSDLLTKLLITRGIDTPKKVQDYLEPLKMDISSPFAFSDMDIAVERILSAVENNEFILVHGDFDADGITSTALLSKLLTFLKANFNVYIPNREKESHGLSITTILPLKAKKKLKLVITCDCATSNVSEIKTLKSLGVETIVTDHHEPSETLPEAIAIINPKVENKLKDDLSTDTIKYLSDLAGVGVAFKLACAILSKIGQDDFIQELLPLVAVGTIADVVPLLGENRVFVKTGLQAISENKNIGISSLLKIAGIDIKKGVRAEDIAFQIAPRLNASGRIDSADEAYDLLTTDCQTQIEFLCHELNNKNNLRQTLCEKIFKEAVEMYETSCFTDEYAIVLYKEDWHMGVIGIVASKLVEKYNKPTLLMCKDNSEEVIRSSARSIEGINIFELLSEMKEYFIKFGGHKGAAGLSFDMKKYNFAQIQKLIFDYAKKYSQGADLTPILNVDMKINLEDLTLDLIDKLSVLEPCGAGNSYPIFAIEGMQLGDQKVIGQKQNHLKFTCKNQNNNTVDCVYWNHSVFEIAQNSPIDIAFYPKKNEFNNVVNLQLDIQDAHYEIASNIKIYDHRQKRDILPLVCDFVSKNIEKTFIYVTDKKLKEILINTGFPLSSFVPKPMVSHLMFFNYPDSKTSMKNIVEKYNPKNLHFMQDEEEIMTIDNFINKILGMIKYAAHNKNGEFDIEAVSEVLNVNNNIVKQTVDVLIDCSAVKLKGIIYEPKLIYNLDYINSISKNVLKESEKFEELYSLWEKSTEFKHIIKTATEENLEKIFQ